MTHDGKNMKSRHFQLFYLPFHYLVDQEYFSVLRNVRLFCEALAGLKDVSIRCTDVELCQFQTQRSSLFSKIKGSTIQYNNKSTELELES